MMKEIFSVNDLTYGYQNKLLFDHFSFSLQKGKITTFITPNNCGKTTLIRIISGFLRTKATIVVDDLVLSKKKLTSYVQKVGVVFENFEEQFFCRTIEEELIFPLENLNYSKKQIQERIAIVSDLFELGVLGREIASLSHYEKAKVLLAVAILHHPKVLFLDNIFSMFSDLERKKIFALLRKMMEKEDITIFLTTNSLLDLFLSDYGMVYYEGKLVYSDVPTKIFENENELSKMGLYLPIMIDLSLKLKFYDLMDEILLDPIEVVDKLWP